MSLRSLTWLVLLLSALHCGPSGRLAPQAKLPPPPPTIPLSLISEILRIPGQRPNQRVRVHNGDKVNAGDQLAVRVWVNQTSYMYLLAKAGNSDPRQAYRLISNKKINGDQWSNALADSNLLRVDGYGEQEELFIIGSKFMLENPALLRIISDFQRKPEKRPVACPPLCPPTDERALVEVEPDSQIKQSYGVMISRIWLRR